MPRAKTILVALLAAFVAAGCSLASEPIPAGPVQSGPLPGEAPQSPVAQPVLAEGQAIYAENCAACHGVDGAGGGAMTAQLDEMGVEVPDMSTAAFHTDRTPAELYSMITNGTMTSGGMMPPWRDSLSETQRWSVTYYLYTLGEGQAILTNGQAVYESTLAACVDEEAISDVGVTSVLTAEEFADEYFADCEGAADISEEDLNAAALYALNRNVDLDTSVAAANPATDGDAAAMPDDDIHSGVEADGEGAAVPDDDIHSGVDAPADDAAATEEPEVVERGTINGIVTMGETTTPAPEGTEVTLRGYVINEMGNVDEFITKTTTTGPDGTYSFADAQFDIPSSAYAVSVMYDGLEYSNGSLINPHETEVDLPIRVFDSTADASAITIKQFNVIAEPVGDNLMVVTQFIGFHNASDQVYFSEEEGAGFQMALPSAAESIEFENNQQLGTRFLHEGNTLKDTLYAYPGDHTVVFRYMLPVSGAMELDLPLMYPAEEVNILVPEGSNLRIDGYEQGEPQQLTQGANFDLYTATNVTDNVAFSVRQSVDVGAIVRTAVIAISITAGIGLIAYAFITRGGFGSPTPQPAQAGYNKSLIQQIAELDQAFEAGKLNRIEYEQKRARLKLALAEEN